MRHPQTFYIYRIDFPNNQFYIGKHIYKGEGKDPNYYGNGILLNDEYERYGKEQKYIKIIAEINPKSIIGKWELEQLETYLIATLNPPLNIVKTSPKARDRILKDEKYWYNDGRYNYFSIADAILNDSPSMIKGIFNTDLL